MPYVEHSHPAMVGHFPGQPVVPGVILIDYMIAAISAQYPEIDICGIHRIRFLQILRPGEIFTIECGKQRHGRLHVWCRVGTTVVADASFLPGSSRPADDSSLIIARQ